MRDIKPLPFKTIEIMLDTYTVTIRTETLEIEYVKYICDILNAYQIRKKIKGFMNYGDIIVFDGSKTQLYNMIIELSIYFNIVIV